MSITLLLFSAIFFPYLFTHQSYIPYFLKTISRLSKFVSLFPSSEWVKVVQSCLTLCNPIHHTIHGILQARILEWVVFSFSRGSSQPIKPRSPSLQADPLPAEPQEKPKNTGVGSLSLLQRIFPTLEPNRGILHCRRILYQLCYQGSPSFF